MLIKKKYKLSETCFYIFWFLLQVGKGLGYTAADAQFKVLVLCGIPFALGRMLLIKWETKSFFKMILLNLLGIATALCSGTTTYLLSIFCITAVKGMDLTKVLKVNLFVRGPMFVIRTALAILGFLDIEQRFRYANGVQVVTRYALGYEHPNTAQFELFMLVVLFFWLYHHRVKVLHYILALVYNVYIFNFTNSRTPFIMAIVFLFGMILINAKREGIMKRILYFWSKKSWIIGVVFTAVGCLLYVNISVFRELGTFASRFLTAVSTIENNSMPLFGVPDITTDLGYVYIIYNGGLIMAVLLFIGTNKLMELKNLQKEIIVQWAFACLAVFNILEHTAYSVLSNGLLLFLVYTLYSTNSVKVRE